MSQKKIISKMNSKGWIYDFLESHKGDLRFFCISGESAMPMHFRTWKEAGEWIKNV